MKEQLAEPGTDEELVVLAMEHDGVAAETYCIVEGNMIDRVPSAFKEFLVVKRILKVMGFETTWRSEESATEDNELEVGVT